MRTRSRRTARATLASAGLLVLGLAACARVDATAARPAHATHAAGARGAPAELAWRLRLAADAAGPRDAATAAEAALCGTRVPVPVARAIPRPLASGGFPLAENWTEGVRYFITTTVELGGPSVEGSTSWGRSIFDDPLRTHTPGWGLAQRAE